LWPSILASWRITRTKKLQAREVPFSPNPNAIILTGIKREWNEREEKKRKKRGGILLLIHTHSERRGIREK
jgi:hypothetical protein